MKDEPSILEPILLTALGSAVLASATTWAGAWVATFLVGGTLDAGVVEGLPALISYFREPGDPAGAWDGSDIPSPWLLYPITALITIAACVGAFWVWNTLWTRPSGFERRDRLGTSPEASLARKKDLGPLRGRFPLKGRFLLGKFGRMPLATEWRANPGVRLSRKARRRQNDRGAVAIIGPSRQGKSVLAISGMLEWDGPLVVSSVKDDLIAPTLPHRRREGQCAVFDPTGFLTNAYRERARDKQVPGWDERLLVSWSPLGGIRTFDHAIAASKTVIDAVPDGGSVENFWIDQTEMMFRSMFWVAAVSEGLGMKDVVRWVLLKDRPTDEGDGEILTHIHHLTLTAERPDDPIHTYLELARNTLESVWSDEDRTLSSVYATARTVIMPWIGESTVLASQGPSVDLEWLVSGNNTLYLSAPPQDQRRLGPVFGGCLNSLFEQAFNYAAVHGPIDPPLLVVLDEAGNMPLKRLPEFVSTVAGLGIQLVTVWQSLAQIKTGYKDAADTVLTNHLTKVFFGAQSDSDALEYVARLVGDEEVATASTTTDTYAIRAGSVQDASQRVALTPANVVRQMEAFTALLVHGALPPAHIRIVKFFEVRRYRKAGRWRLGVSDVGLPELSTSGDTEAERGVAPRPLLEAVSHLSDNTDEEEGAISDVEVVGLAERTREPVTAFLPGFGADPGPTVERFASEPAPDSEDPEQQQRQRESLAAMLFSQDGKH